MITAERAIADLGGTDCKGCGGTKKRKMSHCRSCYFKLPKSLRGRLYNLVGNGYEEAYEESLKLLRGNVENQ